MRVTSGTQCLMCIQLDAGQCSMFIESLRAIGYQVPFSAWENSEINLDGGKSTDGCRFVFCTHTHTVPSICLRRVCFYSIFNLNFERTNVITCERNTKQLTYCPQWQEWLTNTICEKRQPAQTELFINAEGLLRMWSASNVILPLRALWIEL